MRSGRLDRPLLIETPTELNTGGSVSVSWATFAAVWWAEKMPASEGERFEGSGKHSLAEVTFKGRWITGLTEKMRLTDENGTVYRILGIREMDRYRTVLIQAEIVK